MTPLSITAEQICCSGGQHRLWSCQALSPVACESHFKPCHHMLSPVSCCWQMYCYLAVPSYLKAILLLLVKPTLSIIVICSLLTLSHVACINGLSVWLMGSNFLTEVWQHSTLLQKPAWKILLTSSRLTAIPVMTSSHQHKREDVRNIVQAVILSCTKLEHRQ